MRKYFFDTSYHLNSEGAALRTQAFRKYFFDTSYHLNSEGAALRTQAFIKLLKQMQKDGLLGTH